MGRASAAAGWLKDKQVWHSLAASLYGFILAPLVLPIYSSRLLGQLLYAEGLRDELPPEPELPRPQCQMELV
jgi:hypothetical protein